VEDRYLVVQLLVQVVRQPAGDVVVGAVVGEAFIDPADTSFCAEVEVRPLDPLITETMLGESRRSKFAMLSRSARTRP